MGTAPSQNTYNVRYPGLDEANYKKLESKVSALGLTGNNKQKAMDEAYSQVLPLVQNAAKNAERRNFLNDANYQVSQIQDSAQRKMSQRPISIESLCQQIKEKYSVDPTVDDQEMFDSWLDTIPNGEQLLVNYLNNGDKELLYKGGLEGDGKEKLRDNFWKNVWDNMRTMAADPVDSMKKWGVRTMNEATSALFPKIVKKALGDTLPAEMGINLDDYVDSIAEGVLDPRLKDLSMDYQNQVNQKAAERRARNLDQDIKDYYDNKGYTKLLKEGDFKGFIYKSMGDAASNREMPVVIAASIFQPEVGLALMATDTYARENQEAFENMMNNGATYEEAQEGAMVVGLANAAVEVTLDRLLGGVETSTSREIRRVFMKNVQDEAVKKGLGGILMEAGKAQLRSSAEEGLEEVVQQIVQNAAVKTVNENQALFEGVPQAFEGGFYNPMNLLAGGGNLTSNINANKSEIRQSIMDGAYNAGGALGTAYGKAQNMFSKNNNANTATTTTEDTSIIDKVTDWGAEKITNTVSAQDKLYKAQEPRMNVLSNKKNLENRRKNSDRANELIVENGYVPTNTSERLDAHQKTLNKLWKDIENQINQGEGVIIDQTSIIDALGKYIEDKKALGIAGIESDIAALERELEMMKKSQAEGTADLPILENRKQVYNDLIDWKGQEASEVYKGGIKLITSEIGKIEDRLLSEIPGDFSKQKRDVGALLDTYEDVFKADMKNQRSKGMGLTETYSRIEGVGDIVGGLVNTFTKGSEGFAEAAKGAGKFVLGKSLAKAKDADFLIKQGFQELAAKNNKNNQQNGRVMNNEIDESNPAKEMTPEDEYQEMVNRIMTPKEVETIVQMAWNANGLRDFYDGEYRTALEWLRGEGSDQVEMYAENTLATQRMIESHPELLDGGTTFSEVLDAYLNGTLTGKPKETIERLDLSEAEDYTPTKFYEPQELRNGKEVWDEANKRVTEANRKEVYQARGDFVIDAHNPGFVQELGLTDAEVNKKLMSWAAYPAKAKDLSKRINDGVAAPYRWAGLENSSIVKSITVSDGDLEKMVKAVEGNSQEYERKYISNTMLALDTHIDWSPLTFNFVRGGSLNHTDGYNRHHEVLGNYNEATNTINIAMAGQNTVAHEMGHYLDYLWGRQLFGKNVTLSEGGGRNLETLTQDQQKFVRHFDSFMIGLKNSGDLMSEYTMTPTEIFARFVARFTEWTRKTATNNRYDYETKWYDDKFIESDYIEFTKILQEKSKLDLANEYANYDGYLERNEQWRGKPEIRELTMSEEEMRKWQKKGLSKIGDGANGPIYVGLKGNQAVAFLLGERRGEVQGALDMGGEDVDLIWGGYNGNTQRGFGLKKILEKHPEALWKIQDMIDERLNSRQYKSDRVELKDDKGVVVVRLDRDGNEKKWLMTAYDK